MATPLYRPSDPRHLPPSTLTVLSPVTRKSARTDMLHSLTPSPLTSLTSPPLASPPSRQTHTHIAPDARLALPLPLGPIPSPDPWQHRAPKTSSRTSPPQTQRRAAREAYSQSADVWYKAVKGAKG
eukprot:scaffold6691_cov77-Isochrysis_galbana.AAC.1